MQNGAEPHGRTGEDEPIIEPNNALPETSMEALPETLRRAAAAAGWSQLMPVQAKAIPYVLAGRNVMIQSRTGSGKTGAFMLPILHRIAVAKTACQALVLVPTRELARQVAGEAEILGGTMGVRIAAVYGGVAYGPQFEAFRRGAQIVVGTPGRVLDHLLKRTLSLDALQILVFDEADRMLSMGFYPDMCEVQKYLPRRRISGYMFSATFPPNVMRLAGQFLDDPETLSLSRDRVHVTDTEHVFYEVPSMEKDRSLVRIIEIENPASAIIFCNTRTKVHYVAVVLQRFGYDADELSSDLSQGAREKVLGRVRTGALRFLVATDVAARGLDIPDLSHVIQYELPEDAEAYIHRAGRTGRAGASGVAMSLVGGMEVLDLDRIAKQFGIELEKRPLPSDADVEAIVTQRVTGLLEARLRARDNLQTERSQRFVPLARSLAENEDESALIAMLLDDYYQQTLHAPPVPPAGALPPSHPSGPPPSAGGGGSQQRGRRGGGRRGGGRRSR
ncbi:MAG: DEAD/DEAH box helicase [Planctomycetes bacterium]|nr:DEAD/DEAH box helicase [Planctomycetota bacterium]MBI3845009.1 DEAD/DEAH box helicase [Planctomycetota bacterium]